MCQTFVPSVLYRYDKVSRWDYFFEKQTLCFAPLANFNDPFEGKPATKLVYVGGEKAYFAFLNFAKRMISKYPLYYNFPAGISEFLRESVLFPFESNIVTLKNSGVLRNYIHAPLAREYGAYCLADSADNILMWSHYAESHKGFVVGFNTKTLLNNIDDDIILDIVEIEYSQNRPYLTMDDSVHSEDVNESRVFLKKCFFTKSIQWAYEREWRILISFRGHSGRKIEKIQHLTPNAIDCIIFGLGMSESAIREKCRAVRAQNEYAHVNFKRATMHNADYAVVIEDIDNDFFSRG